MEHGVVYLAKIGGGFYSDLRFDKIYEMEYQFRGHEVILKLKCELSERIYKSLKMSWDNDKKCALYLISRANSIWAKEMNIEPHEIELVFGRLILFQRTDEYKDYSKSNVFEIEFCFDETLSKEFKFLLYFEHKIEIEEESKEEHIYE